MKNLCLVLPLLLLSTSTFAQATIQTQTLTQMPLTHPAWEPSEETKRRALIRAYEWNGNLMVGGCVDVTKEPPRPCIGAVSPPPMPGLKPN